MPFARKTLFSTTIIFTKISKATHFTSQPYTRYETNSNQELVLEYVKLGRLWLHIDKMYVYNRGIEKI